MFSKEEIKSTISKLNGANYSVWKIKMELVLIKEDLWDIVSKPKPIEPDANWMKKDGQARACIGLMVEDPQLVYFKNAENAYDFWKNLKDHYEKPSLSTRVHIMKTICKMQLTDDEKMEAHINEMMMFIDQLAVMGDPLSESWAVAMLLRSLPDTYDPLIVALEDRNDGQLNLNFVKGKLIEEAIRKVHKRFSSDETVMKVHKRKQHNSTRKCFYCDKVGHFKKDCRFYKEAMFKKNKINKTGKSEGQNNQEHCFWLGKCLEKVWYLDSGATCHISNHKSFFMDLNENHVESVNVANGYQINSQGKGCGYIEVIKEDSSTERILIKDVLYVPSIECNLLSVKKLAEKGYGVNFEKKVCRIMKNNKTIAFGDLVKDLYKLRISITKKYNGLNLVNNDRHNGCIHEWHRKMGHRDINIIRKMLKDANVNVNNCGNEEECEICLREQQTHLRRSKRSNFGEPPKRLAYLIKNVEPCSYKQAMECDEKEKWIDAMNEEMKSLKVNETWKIVPLPEGRKAIGCKWIYKIKRSSNGEILKYKARQPKLYKIS